jgi:hypothetical protein
VFINVLRDSLASYADASDLLLPRVDLSQLFPERAAEFVHSRGGEVRAGEAVRSIEAGLRIGAESFFCNRPRRCAVPARAFCVSRRRASGILLSADLHVLSAVSAARAVSVPDARTEIGTRAVDFRSRCAGREARARILHDQRRGRAPADDARRARWNLPSRGDASARRAARSAVVAGYRRKTRDLYLRAGNRSPRAGNAHAGALPRRRLTPTPDYPPVLEAAVRSGVRAARKILALL